VRSSCTSVSFFGLEEAYNTTRRYEILRTSTVESWSIICQFFHFPSLSLFTCDPFKMWIFFSDSHRRNRGDSCLDIFVRWNHYVLWVSDCLFQRTSAGGWHKPTVTLDFSERPFLLCLDLLFAYCEVQPHLTLFLNNSKFYGSHHWHETIREIPPTELTEYFVSISRTFWGGCRSNSDVWSISLLSLFSRVSVVALRVDVGSRLSITDCCCPKSGIRSAPRAFRTNHFERPCRSTTFLEKEPSEGP